MAVDIHRQWVEVYDSVVTFSQRVANWYRTFASDRDNVMNGNRGGRRSSTIEYSTRRVKELVQTLVRLHLMASELGLFFGTVQYTVMATLQYRMVYDRWVSSACTDNNKPARIISFLTFPQRYAVEENGCLR